MSSLMESWPRKHRITVDEYYRMAEVGLLAPDARVELIEGEIIDMAPIGTDHGSVVDVLTRLFIRALGDQAIVRTQGAILLDQRSMPQPDLAVLAPSSDDYRRTHPTPANIWLVIEVSDSTLRYDRKVKVPLYARHGIPEVWIVDLPDGELHWYRGPRDGGYTEQGSSDTPGTMPLTALPDVAIDLGALFAGQCTG
jgi:Uma2 family endonuclease